MPPVFTTDTDFAAGTTTPLSVTRLNQDIGANGNLMYLFNRPAFAKIFRNGGSNYTVTNSQTFADLDATNLTSGAITIYSTRFLCIASFVCDVTSAGAEFDVIANSTRCGDATHGLIATQSTTLQGLTVIAPFTGLTPGSTTFKLQCRTTSTNSLNILCSSGAVVFFGVEY